MHPSHDTRQHTHVRSMGPRRLPPSGTPMIPPGLPKPGRVANHSSTVIFRSRFLNPRPAISARDGTTILSASPTCTIVPVLSHRKTKTKRRRRPRQASHGRWAGRPATQSPSSGKRARKAPNRRVKDSKLSGGDRRHFSCRNRHRPHCRHVHHRYHHHHRSRHFRPSHGQRPVIRLDAVYVQCNATDELKEQPHKLCACPLFSIQYCLAAIFS